MAWATFIAQGIACVLALITMVKRLKQIKTDKKAEYFSADMLKRIARIAIPSILQQSFVSIGNIFVQGLINSFGSSVIACYSAAIKLNTFTITSFTTLGNGISSFTAQNIGAGKVDRVKQGMVLRKHLPERNVSMKKKKQQSIKMRLMRRSKNQSQTIGLQAANRQLKMQKRLQKKLQQMSM